MTNKKRSSQPMRQGFKPTRGFKFNRSAAFWWALILLCLTQITVALYYQYVLDSLPCVLCVQVRALVSGLLLVAVAGLYLRRTWPGLVIANGITLAMSLGMLQRAWATFATERGWVAGNCGAMEAAFPSWMPLDKWLPAVFQPLEPCGVTPWIIPSLMSMADTLLLIATTLVAVMLVMLVSSLFYLRSAN